MKRDGKIYERNGWQEWKGKSLEEITVKGVQWKEN